MSCPRPEVLRAFVELELDASGEASLRQHLGDCGGCSDQVRELDPAWLFAELPAETLPAAAWADVLRAVRAEVVANPRPGPSEYGFGAWLRGFWDARLAPGMAVAAVAVGLVVASARVVGPPATLEPVIARADEPVGRSFVYLSNPDAEVADILVAFADGRESVQVTMVIDETLADLF